MKASPVLPLLRQLKLRQPADPVPKLAPAGKSYVAACWKPVEDAIRAARRAGTSSLESKMASEMQYFVRICQEPGGGLESAGSQKMFFALDTIFGIDYAKAAPIVRLFQGIASQVKAGTASAKLAPAASPASTAPQPFRRPGVVPLRNQPLPGKPPLIVPRHGSEPEERSDAVAKWINPGKRRGAELPDALKAPIKFATKVPVPQSPEIMQTVRTGLQNLFTRSNKGIVPHDWSSGLEERVVQALLQDNKAAPLPPAGKLNLEITRKSNKLVLDFYSVDEENALRATFDIPPSDLKRWPVPAKVQLIKKEALDLYTKVFGWLRKIEASLDNDTQKEILFALRGLFTIRETAELIPQAAPNGTSAYEQKDYSLRYEMTPQKALKVTLRILDHQWTGTLTLNAPSAEPALQLIGPGNQPAPIPPPAATSAPTTSAPVALAGDIDKKALADAFAKNAENFGVAITADEAKPLVEAVDILRSRIGKEEFHSSNHVLVAVPRHGHFYLETNAQNVEEFNAVTLWREYMFAPSFKIDLPRVQSSSAAVKPAPTAAPASTTAPAPVTTPVSVPATPEPRPELVPVPVPEPASLEMRLAKAIRDWLPLAVKAREGWTKDGPKVSAELVEKGTSSEAEITAMLQAKSGTWKNGKVCVRCISGQNNGSTVHYPLRLSRVEGEVRIEVGIGRDPIKKNITLPRASSAGPSRASYGDVDMKNAKQIDQGLEYFFQKARDILGIKEKRALTEDECDQAVVLLLQEEGKTLSVETLRAWRKIAKKQGGLKGRQVFFPLAYAPWKRGRSQCLWYAMAPGKIQRAAGHYSLPNNSVYISVQALLAVFSVDRESMVKRIAQYERLRFIGQERDLDGDDRAYLEYFQQVDGESQRERAGRAPIISAPLNEGAARLRRLPEAGPSGAEPEKPFDASQEITREIPNEANLPKRAAATIQRFIFPEPFEVMINVGPGEQMVATDLAEKFVPQLSQWIGDMIVTANDNINMADGNVDVPPIDLATMRCVYKNVQSGNWGIPVGIRQTLARVLITQKADRAIIAVKNPGRGRGQFFVDLIFTPHKDNVRITLSGMPFSPRDGKEPVFTLLGIMPRVLSSRPPAAAADGGVKLAQAANGENIQVQSNGNAFNLDAGWSRPDIKGVRFRIVEIIP